MGKPGYFNDDEEEDEKKKPSEDPPDDDSDENEESQYGIRSTFLPADHVAEFAIMKAWVRVHQRLPRRLCRPRYAPGLLHRAPVLRPVPRPETQSRVAP
jgi:hypothetical protein